MATRTISNTGGNYNATGTWVEGIVPTSSDDIVATATSGQLTVNVTSAARSFDFTNYTNTLTVNAVLNVSGSSATNNFGASMSFAGTNGIQLTASCSLRTNGKTINSIILSFTNTGIKTLLDDLNISGSMLTGPGTINGFSINSSGTYTTSPATGTTNIRIKNGTITSNNASLNSTNIGLPIFFEGGSNTITITSSLLAVSGDLTYTSGTIASTTTLYIKSGTTTSTDIVLDISGMTLKDVFIDDIQYTNNIAFTISLSSNLNYTGTLSIKKTTNNQAQGSTNMTNVIFGGTGRILGNIFISNNVTEWVATQGLTSLSNSNIKFNLASLANPHTFTEFQLYGNLVSRQPTKSKISSNVGGSQSYISISGTSSCILWDFQDIYSINPIYAVYGSASNTNAVISLLSPSTATAWTFVN